MKDMTKGPVSGHILQLSAFIALTTFFQTLYFLADLYFVGRLGTSAIAGVAVAGNISFIVLALTQSLGVGTTSLLAQALGRQDHPMAERVFNQSLVLSTLAGGVFAVVMFLVRHAYAGRLAADAETARLGVEYLDWFVPALAMQFGLVAMGSALRGMGDMRVPTIIQVSTVVLNIVLAPVLIFGIGSGRPLGVTGAALASFIAISAGAVAFVRYFLRRESYLTFDASLWTPDPALWWRMLKIGLPAGGEFALMSVNFALIYDIIKPFGAGAQAGFGIGGRVIQALFLPTVAIAFAASPVAAQNFGARQGPRVRQTFYAAAKLSAVVMITLSLLCHIAPGAMIRFFNGDPQVVAFGEEYLRIISWNFVASGLVFVSSAVFQGMGNTLPPLGASCIRLGLFAIPAYMLAQQPGFELRHVWYMSTIAVTLQMCVSLWLLHREFDRRLTFAAQAEPAAAVLEQSVG
jgi:putative MATE family efflux protein